MFDRDLFAEFANGTMDSKLDVVIRNSLDKNGLFGYINFLKLHRDYAVNNIPSFFIGDDVYSDCSNKNMLLAYAEFINKPLVALNIARLSFCMSSRQEWVDHGVTIASHDKLSPYDIASSNVENVGKEARLLLLHRTLTGGNTPHVFHMNTAEYLRVVITKFNVKAYSHAAVDLIVGIATSNRDIDTVIYLMFTVLSFTSVKTYGLAETNSKDIAEVALQLCGSGVVALDYYFKKIHEVFHDKELMINYDLLAAIFEDTGRIASKVKTDIFEPTISGTYKRSFAMVLKQYISNESSNSDISDRYFQVLMHWRDNGILPPNDIRDDIRYVNAMCKCLTEISTLKAAIENDLVKPHFLFNILKGLIDFSSDLNDNISLWDLDFYNNVSIDAEEDKLTAFSNHTFVLDRIRKIFADSLFQDKPIWKHCLLVILYLKVECDLPFDISRSTLTEDIKREVEFYYNLYKSIDAGKPYVFMLSP